MFSYHYNIYTVKVNITFSEVIMNMLQNEMCSPNESVGTIYIIARDC